MYTLQPNLTLAQRTMVTDWMLEVLASNGLASRSNSFPNLGNLFIWKDGQAKLIQRGAWQVDESYIHIGQESGMVSQTERLEIISTFVPLCNPARGAELQTALHTALTRVVLGMYRTFQGNIVASASPVSQVAINPDQTQIAALSGETWHLPGGEPATVGDGWTILSLPA